MATKRREKAQKVEGEEAPQRSGQREAVETAGKARGWRGHRAEEIVRWKVL